MCLKTRNLAIASVVLGLIVVSGLANAQQPQINKSLPKNPPPCYHKEFKDFAFLEGNWEVKLNTRLADGKWEETAASSQIKPDLSGCLLVERLAGSREGRSFNVLSFFAFDNNSKRLQHLLSDSEHGLLALYEGRKLAGEILLDLEFTRDDGSKAIVRRAYSDITKDSFTLESKHSRDGGKTWLAVMKARYSRKR